MANTPYSSKQQEFTDLAHLAARKQFYPLCFGVSPKCITYEPPSGWIKHLDLNYAIDRVFHVDYPHRSCLRASLLATVQERFRQIGYQKYQDATVTEWNDASKSPSELYKFAPMYFSYGYYDQARDQIIEAMLIYATLLIDRLADGSLVFESEKPNPRSDQWFAPFPFQDLYRVGVVRNHFKEVNGRLVCQKRQWKKKRKPAFSFPVGVRQDALFASVEEIA